tara:strand:- start:240 stop:764 length:525 start_codon:yes stop_codon:yes gene_type:complete
MDGEAVAGTIRGESRRAFAGTFKTGDAKAYEVATLCCTVLLRENLAGAVRITIGKRSEAACSRAVGNIRWRFTVATIPSKFLAVEVDGVGIMLILSVVTLSITDPCDGDAVAVAVVDLVCTAPSATIGGTLESLALDSREVNASPDFADQLLPEDAVAAVETAGAHDHIVVTEP